MTVRNSERGFNLVEVLIAMAVTAMVVVSVATLFYLGRQNVYDAKQVTAATAVVTRIEEDLSHMTRAEVYTFFNLAGTSIGKNWVGATKYDNSIVRDSNVADDIDVAKNDKAGYLKTWVGLMPKDRFVNGRIRLVFMPRLDTVDPKTDTGTTAKSNVLQIRGVIEWTEGLRTRSYVIDAVKTVRT